MEQEDIENYKKYLIENIESSIRYNEYLNEHNNSLIDFLKIINFKEGAELNKVTEFIGITKKLSEEQASFIDTLITFLNNNSKQLNFDDVHNKSKFYQRIIKIKEIENGSTEA